MRLSILDVGRFLRERHLAAEHVVDGTQCRLGRSAQLLISAEVLREAGENNHGAESLGSVQVKGGRAD